MCCPSVWCDQVCNAELLEFHTLRNLQQHTESSLQALCNVMKADASVRQRILESR